MWRAILLTRVLTLYLAALVLGLGLFAIQLASSSGGGDTDAAHDGGHQHLGDGAPLLGAGVDSGNGDPGSDGAHPAAGGWASMFISLRFYMFAAIAFGVVGAPVTAFGLSGPQATLVAALATALGVGAAATFALRALGRETLGEGVSPAELRGQLGRVLVAVEKGRIGKVRLTVHGQSLDMVATTDEERLPAGVIVLVQDVHAQRVHVCAAPGELLPE